MSTHNSISYIDPRNINLRGGARGAGVIRWDRYSHAGLYATNPFGSDEIGLYVNDSGGLTFSYLGSAVVLGSGSGGGAGDTLDSAYDNGRTITADAGALTINGVNQDTNVLLINGDGDSAGALLQLTHTTNTRKDINGTGSTWFVTGQGAATFTAIDLQDNELITLGTGNDATIGWDASKLAITGVVDFANNVTLAASATVVQTGAAGSTVYTITAGDVVWSDSSLALTDADNAESVTIINNTATTIGAAASAGVVQIESTSLTTGAALNVQLTEGTLNGGFYYSAWDATAGARVWSVGENGAMVATGSAAGTDVLTLTAGDVTLTSGHLVLTAGNFTMTVGDAVLSDGSLAITDADNAASLTVTNNTITTANALVDVASTSITTGALMRLNANTDAHDGEVLEIISSGDTTSTPVGMSVVIAEPTTGAARGIDVTMVGATTGPIGLKITMDAITESSMVYLDNGGASLTTGFFINCNDDGAGLFTVGANGATVIAGSASGTAALTVTAGDFVMGAGVLRLAVSAGVTAAVGSSQGDGPITRSIVEIATVGTGGDAVTLPAAAAGQVVYVINHGANAADVFPASGDTINEGTVDVATSCAVNETLLCIAYDTGNWEVVALARNS